MRRRSDKNLKKGRNLVFNVVNVVLLEGKKINLRIMEKEDLPLFVEWVNKPEVFGEYNPLHQMSRTEAEKMLDNPSDIKPFIIEKRWKQNRFHSPFSCLAFSNWN